MPLISTISGIFVFMLRRRRANSPAPLGSVALIDSKPWHPPKPGLMNFLNILICILPAYKDLLQVALVLVDQRMNTLHRFV